MIATPCPPPSSLRSLSAGHLSERDSDTMFGHIDQCDNCRNALHSIQDDQDWLIDSLRSPSAANEFENEPGYRSALARALGAIEHLNPEYGDLSIDPQLPKNIGEYELIRLLGRGGMGRVYLARHSKLGREVALKLIANHRLNSPHATSRFEVEMRAVGQLNHPNIVTAFDAREINGTAVLVTEFIEGLDLAEIINRTGQLSIADACEIGRVVVQALEHIAKQGLVHRDIKPSNIMVSSEGQLKILDLGLARYLHNNDTAGMTGTGQIMGTIDYAAPEQIQGSQKVDFRSDFYSLGCTLYHALTGHPPFDSHLHQTPYAKMTAQVSQTPPSLLTVLPDAPKPLAKLVDAMLAKDPNQRPQSVSEITSQLGPHFEKSDLRSLVAHAKNCEARSPVAKPRATSVSTDTAPKTSAFYKRPIPAWIAVAAGFFGVTLGILLGILIVIKLPDGSTIFMDAPNGTSVAIRDSNNSAIVPAPPNDVTGPKPSEPSKLTVSPLILAATVEAEDVDPEQLNNAITALREHKGNLPLETPIGIWHPLSESSNELSVIAIHDGKRYSLVRADAEGLITWDFIAGNIGATVQASGQSLLLSFSDMLGEKVYQLTKKNLLGHLAVVINGEIIAAPKIVSPIRDKAALTGNFKQEKLDYLMQALNGLVQDPSRSESSSAEPIAVQDLSTVKPSAEADREVIPLTGNPEIQPLAFAATVVPTSVDQDALRGAIDSLKAHAGREPLKTPVGTWYPLNKACKNIESSVEHDNTRYTLVHNDRRSMIRWEEIKGNTSIHLTERGYVRQLRFYFKNALSDRIEQLTYEHMQKGGASMTAIVDGEILSVFPLNVTLRNNLGFSENIDQHAGETLKQLLSEEIETDQSPVRNDFIEIGKAIDRYQDLYGKLPGSKNTYRPVEVHEDKLPLDADIKPYSWRVAILPYLGLAELFAEYDFTREWDSEHNKKLLAKIPSVYRQTESQAELGTTRYVGIDDPKSAMGQPLTAINDGTLATIFMIEAEENVPWTEPKDFELSTAKDRVWSHPLSNLRVDGTYSLLQEPSATYFRELSIRNDGSPRLLTR